MRFLGVLCLFTAFGATELFGARALSPFSRHALKSGHVFKFPYPKNWLENEVLLKVLAEINSTGDLRQEAKKLVLSNHDEDKLIELNLMLASQIVLELKNLKAHKNGKLTADELTPEERKRVWVGLKRIVMEDSSPSVFKHSAVKAFLAE